MIPNGDFATRPIFARTAIWNHWEMRKEVVHLCVALDARELSSIDSEMWALKKRENKTQIYSSMDETDNY